MERIEFQTSDGANIVGSFSRPTAANSAVLLLHMWPNDRMIWMTMQGMLAEKNIASLAIDLCGHGESSAGDTSDLDIQGALSWLAASGFPASHVALMGASIGANLALRALAQNHDISSAVLLSPGANYHGVTTFDFAASIDPSQSLFIAASSGDDQQSFDDSQEIIRLAPSQEKVWKPFANAGHALHLFESHPELANETATWLAEHFS